MKFRISPIAKTAVAALMAAALIMPLTTGCTAKQVNSFIQKAQSGTLTKADIVAGLKEALKKGIDTGINSLAAKDGYYSQAATRIGLPAEAAIITQNIAKVPGGQALVDALVKSINAAATDAVKEAGPIFASALTSMTINDAVGILKNNNKQAATDYFRTATKSQLKALFAKYIKTSINKKLVSNVSAQSSWDTLTSKWNTVAKSAVGKAAGFTTVNTDLCDFLTDQAVEGIFKKVAEQEKEIRANVSARTTPLLKKVFAQQ